MWFTNNVLGMFTDKGETVLLNLGDTKDYRINGGRG